MWRAFFLAVGVILCILGAQCLVIEKAVFAAPARPAATATGLETPIVQAPASREVEPPEWAPWSMISAGAVVMLYSFTIPRRVNG